MKKSTRGSAKPSFRPDSRLSVCRTDSGTPRDLTTAEVTTGSVGESTAPSRKASAQLSSENSTLAQRARNRSVSGMRHQQCANRRAPVDLEPLPVDQQPIGEQGHDQRQLDQVDDGVILGAHLDHAGAGEQQPGGHA